MNSDTGNQKYEVNRSNRLLMKKFGQYLLPTMITSAAVSLNEFADSMVVSRLLGSQGLAIVNLGAPVMLAVAAAFCLLGCGGSTIYAISLGRRDHEGAGRSFTAAMSVALFTGLLMFFLGFVFFRGISGILCDDPLVKPAFNHYLRVLLLSVPLLVTILTFVEFLPPAGLPTHATVVNVVANVVNIIMDYVYIHVFGMGVEGAAWATLTGYVVSLVVVVYALARKKLKFYVSKEIFSSLKYLWEIFKQGGSDAMTQVGFTLQYAVCNSLALGLAGMNGVVAYSLCQQSLSVISIFMSALIGAATPIMAVLHGQHDFRGQAGILRTSLIGQFIVAVLCTGSFIIFAPQAAALYNITEPDQVIMAVRALRVFSLCYLVRSTTILYFRYLKILGMTGYATLIGALDGFLGVVPVTWIMTRLIGVEGVWWAYPVNAVLVMIFILIRNSRILKRSEGSLKTILLFEREVDARPVMDITITNDPAQISGMSRTLQQICENNGLDTSSSVHAALAVEEMAVYASNHKKQDAYMDVLVRIFEGNVEIDFRSLGPSFDPANEEIEEMETNIRMLRAVSDRIENEYIMGMNATRITIAAH